MNLKQLEAFVHVAEGGSFSRAARELYLTQPTISAHISALEKELNIRLFIRNTKEVALSDDGRELYKYARKIIDLEYQIREHFHVNADAGKRSVTIAASTIPAQYLLPSVLMLFQERYPKERFKLIETDSAKVVTHIIEGVADIGFTGTVLEKKYCKYIPFYKDKLTIITPNTSKYQKLKQEATGVAWMKKESIILREEGSGTRKEAEKQLKKAGVPMNSLNVIASIDNQETIKRSVRQGMGISILSQLATEEEVASGQILSFEIPKSDEGRNINLVYNKNSHMGKNIERFVRIVDEVYGMGKETE